MTDKQARTRNGLQAEWDHAVECAAEQRQTEPAPEEATLDKVAGVRIGSGLRAGELFSGIVMLNSYGIQVPDCG